MSTWTAQRTAKADPAAVLDVLTDPSAAGRWAPVDFEVSELVGRRLRTGSRARVAGRLAGREVGFDVEYRLRPVAGGSEVHASVGVRPAGRGLAGRVLAHATSVLLAGGALQSAVTSIAREAEAVAAL